MMDFCHWLASIMSSCHVEKTYLERVLEGIFLRLVVNAMKLCRMMQDISSTYLPVSDIIGELNQVC